MFVSFLRKKTAPNKFKKGKKKESTPNTTLKKKKKKEVKKKTNVKISSPPVKKKNKKKVKSVAPKPTKKVTKINQTTNISSSFKEKKKKQKIKKEKCLEKQNVTKTKEVINKEKTATHVKRNSTDASMRDAQKTFEFEVPKLVGIKPGAVCRPQSTGQRPSSFCEPSEHPARLHCALSKRYIRVEEKLFNFEIEQFWSYRRPPREILKKNFQNFVHGKNMQKSFLKQKFFKTFPLTIKYSKKFKSSKNCSGL